MVQVQFSLIFLWICDSRLPVHVVAPNPNACTGGTNPIISSPKVRYSNFDSFASNALSVPITIIDIRYA